MKSLSECFRGIPPWRVILAAALLFGLSLQAYDSLSYTGCQPSFQETLLSRLNDVTTFSFYFILLLLIADLGFKKSTGDGYNKDRFVRSLVSISLLSLVFIAVYIVFCLFAILLRSDSLTFSNEWKCIRLFGLEQVSPWGAVGASVLLFFFRLTFISCLVYVVNSRCKRIPFGYIGGFAVCLLDGIVYYCFSHGKALGIFPFEHSYLDSALRITYNMPIDISINVLYWLMLIAAAGLIHSASGKHAGQDGKREQLI